MSQEDFFKELGMETHSDNEENKETGSKFETESQAPQEKGKLPKPNDGLNFKCEICEDSGCPQCGCWGKRS